MNQWHNLALNRTLRGKAEQRGLAPRYVLDKSSEVM
jgi:hypothetical protein